MGCGPGIFGNINPTAGSQASQAHVDRDAFFGTKEQWDAFLRDEESGARGRPTVQQAIAQQAAGTQTVAAQAGAPEPVEQQPAPQQPLEQQSGVQQADAEQPALQSAEQQ